MKEFIIVRVYKVVELGEMVAVDFLRKSETGETYRMLKYFYADEWAEDISVTMRYKECRAFDQDNTIAKEVLV